MYKVLVRENQFFDDTFTIGDVIKHFAERADLNVDSADMLFYYPKIGEKRNSLCGVITKSMADDFLAKNIEFSQLAREYVDEDYKVIDEETVTEFTKSVCPQDTPVLNANGKPIYVILKGYLKTNRSEHYMCKVLSGLSIYNLSVNADMSVSCNCMLRQGGQLGDLKHQTLEEIYASPHVARMRKNLLDGFLPTVSCCKRCDELIQVPKSYGMYYLENYHIPASIMFESVSACNLKCVGCFNQYINKNTVTLEDTIKFAIECKKHDIKYVYMFKYGEPFLDVKMGEKIDIIREYNPNIKIIVSTNGVLLNINNNMENALKLNKVVFSLDGIDDETVLEFQKNNHFEQVYNNMCQLVKLRNEAGVKDLEIEWKYVLFQHNDADEMIEKVFQMAERAGVDRVLFYKGFNTKTASSAVWKSEAFLKYMRQYKFEFSGGHYIFRICERK